MVKNPSANVGDAGGVSSIPGSGRSPGESNGKPLQYSCLENPMDSGAWWATVHGVAKSWTLLNTEVLTCVCQGHGVGVSVKVDAAIKQMWLHVNNC